MDVQDEEEMRAGSLEYIDDYDQLPRYSLTGGKLCPEQLLVAHLPEDHLTMLTKFSKSCPHRRFESQVNVELRRITEQLTRSEERRNSRLCYDPRHSIKRNAEINVMARWDERGIWNHNWPEFKPGLLWGHEGTPADFDFGPNVYLQKFDEEYIGDQYLTSNALPETNHNYARWKCIPHNDNYSIGVHSSLNSLLRLSRPGTQFSDEYREECEWFYGEPEVLVDHDTYRALFAVDNPLSITTRRFRGISTVDRFGQELPVYEDGAQRVVDIFGYEAVLHGNKICARDHFDGDILEAQIDMEQQHIVRSLRKRWEADEIWDSNWSWFPPSGQRGRWLHEALKPGELKIILADDAGCKE